jgi:gp16 family phage-associated protein
MRPAAVNTKPEAAESSTTRAALLAKGYTVASFARAHGFSYGTVQAVIHRRRGLRDRGISRRIREKLTEVTA